MDAMTSTSFWAAFLKSGEDSIVNPGGWLLCSWASDQ